MLKDFLRKVNKMRTDIIDCSNNSFSDSLTYAIAVWEKLFDYYRNHGGNLNNMIDMLIDFNTLKQKLDDFFKSPYPKENIEFYWGTIEYNGYTTISDFRDFSSKIKIVIFNENGRNKVLLHYLES